MGDSVLVVDDNNLVGVGKLSLKASDSTTTFFNRGLVSISTDWTVRVISKVTVLVKSKQQACLTN